MQVQNGKGLQRVISVLSLAVLAPCWLATAASALAPPDAASNPETIAIGDTLATSTPVPSLAGPGQMPGIPFPVWTALGIVMIVGAVVAFLILRQQKTYEPRAKRLRK
ncbi:MAG: hypothetical protein NQU46_06215 [Methanolinea sp.]|nr:hypothetical protein [Methanolinea sp.]